MVEAEAENKRRGAGAGPKRPYSAEELDLLAFFCTLVKIVYIVGALDLVQVLVKLIGSPPSSCMGACESADAARQSRCAREENCTPQRSETSTRTTAASPSSWATTSCRSRTAARSTWPATATA
jgi:hypothetical protein